MHFQAINNFTINVPYVIIEQLSFSRDVLFQFYWI